MSANYNNSAWFYDRLSTLVYGKALMQAQLYLLQFIRPESKVLIAGGGTGRVLEEIAKIDPSGLTITYIEIAPKMMTLSRKRNTGNNEVIFINNAVENVDLSTNFDVILTPFLFDNFTEENFRKIFIHIHRCLKPGGSWLNADFQLAGKWWQKMLLQMMMLFFRIVCRIEAKKLPDISKGFTDHGYQVTGQETFFGDFILSTVYQKP